MNCGRFVTNREVQSPYAGSVEVYSGFMEPPEYELGVHCERCKWGLGSFSWEARFVAELDVDVAVIRLAAEVA